MYPSMSAVAKDDCLSNVLAVVTLLGLNSSEIGSMRSSSEKIKEMAAIHVVFNAQTAWNTQIKNLLQHSL